MEKEQNLCELLQSNVNSPHVLEIIEVIKTEKDSYIIQELCDDTLSHYLLQRSFT